jgi:error-prone DNA polymerase
MGAWRKSGVIEMFHKKLVDGMLKNGYDGDFAERVFKQISGFGEYGFPESHAASFALLVYVSAWLKRYHPAAFTAALINSQPMGFYAPAQLVRDARDHGVRVVPADVNFSDWDCTLEPISVNHGPEAMAEATGVGTAAGVPSKGSSRAARFRHFDEAVQLRLGFRLLHGFSQEFADAIVRTRQSGGAFQSFDDFARRTQLGRSALKLLASADAFASLEIGRRDALWKSIAAQQTMPLFQDVDGPIVEESDPELPELTAQEDVVHDYATTGLSLKKHPMSFLRDQLTQLRAICAEALATHEADRRVKVAGLVLMRQRPQTAGGITFMTLEDETGIANIVVYPNVWTRFRQTARFASVLMASGRLQREGDIIHVVCDRLDDVSDMLERLQSRSRDFR